MIKHMKKHYTPHTFLRTLLVLISVLLVQPSAVAIASGRASQRDNAKWVNPLIGTAFSTAPTLWGNYGGTYPGAVSPWGMVQLSPETSARPSEKGYYYSDTHILKFTCLAHNSGYPNGSAGRLAIVFMRGSHDTMPQPYVGRAYHHSEEKARPGSYSVRFDDGDSISLASATHAGILSYTTSCSTTTVMLCQGGGISVITPTEVHCAYRHSVLTFSRPMTHHTLRGDTLFAQFDTPSQLDVRLSVSESGFSQSRINGEAQLQGGDLKAVSDRAYADWQRELQCVDINGASESLMRMFYTALYHSMLVPYNVADVNEPPHYSGFSPWDTFRTLHPLLTLLKPKVQADIVDAMMDEYAHRGELPKGPMTGYHAIPILLDSYVKGVSHHSAAELYAACRQSCDSVLRGEAVRQYRQQGYVGASEEQSVSITAELAYDDWAMMRFCQLLGDTVMAGAYAQRAVNYANLWDEETLFMLPREGNHRLRHSGELGYQESNRWTASLFAPHNVVHLVNLCGGAERFAQRLQHDFAEGRILFDNETVLHYPWLYVWARRPELAMQRVKSIATECYADTPGGIPGNDDLGSMSSWLAFATMGIMPSCTGTDQYIIIPPLASEVILHLPCGKTMRITSGVARTDSIMPQPSLNGVRLNRCHITHSELMAGGIINYDWHTALNVSTMQLPYSMDAGEPQFRVEPELRSALRVRPDEEFRVPFRVSNSGADGVCTVFLTCGTDTVASSNVRVGTGASAEGTLVGRFYAEGHHVLRLADSVLPLTVMKSRKGSQRIGCVALSVKPVIRKGEEVSAYVALKNISGRNYEGTVPLIIDGKHTTDISLHLAPGAESEHRVALDVIHSVGMHTVGVLGVATKMKVCADTLSATVLDVTFANGTATDTSGFCNDGACHGALQWGLGTVTTSRNAYVEFPASASLMYPWQEFTMLTWVRQESVSDGGYIDFFTKGDCNVLKMQGKGRLGFFAGGWGRGECETAVPTDWDGSWHLVAGVCSRGVIRLYIDGHLAQAVPVQGKVGVSAIKWNLGRNAEMPYSRFGTMTFRGTRIYAAALTDAMLCHIYESERSAVLLP